MDERFKRERMGETIAMVWECTKKDAGNKEKAVLVICLVGELKLNYYPKIKPDKPCLCY